MRNISPYRRAFHVLIAGSVAFVVVTFASFAFEGHGHVSRLLFWLGLAGENNVGAWWSGMLLLVAALLAFESSASAASRPQARGWRSLALALTVLSFDEIAALHEHLSNTSDLYIAALALVIAGLCVYALAMLYRAGTPSRTLGLIVAAFVLFALVPVQEYLQQTREWPNPIIYGVRAAIEEGTELAAILLLIAAAGRNRLSVAGAARVPFETLGGSLTAVLITAALLWPMALAATRWLPAPSGPADWLASSLYLCGGLLAAQRAFGEPSARVTETLAVAWWLGASAGSNAVSLSWDPHLGGAPISVRGLFLAALLISAVLVLRPGTRFSSVLLAASAVLAVVLARHWPQSPLLWCALPPLVAWWIFALRSRGAARSSSLAVASGTHLAVETAEPISGSSVDG